jgi:hypothetical protein
MLDSVHCLFLSLKGQKLCPIYSLKKTLNFVTITTPNKRLLETIILAVKMNSNTSTRHALKSYLSSLNLIYNNGWYCGNILKNPHVHFKSSKKSA